jgi:uncharacterized protein YdeI (YjbR/CyaY-like superfamily)
MKQQLESKSPLGDAHGTMTVTFFKSAAEFRVWLARHHDKAAELWVGFYRKDSRRSGITYAEALDQALCFGWIDGVRKKVDDAGYTNRFSPRKAKSIWSLVNTRRAKELRKLGLMQPPGLKAFRARKADNTGVYSFENRADCKLAAGYERQFKGNKGAWAFFNAQPPGYRRTVIWWVMSAKRPETQQRRLGRLIDDCAKGRRLSLLA